MSRLRFCDIRGGIAFPPGFWRRRVCGRWELAAGAFRAFRVYNLQERLSAADESKSPIQFHLATLSDTGNIEAAIDPSASDCGIGLAPVDP